MMKVFKIKTIEDQHITGKAVLIRTDYNVTLTSSFIIRDDYRIRLTIPTITYLLRNNNKLIIVSHLGRPKGRDSKYSLRPVAKHLNKLLPKNRVILVDDFTSKKGRQIIDNQKNKEIILLENIRFYKEELDDDDDFAKLLASLADVYVNDAFGNSHRKHASIYSITRFIPSFAGKLLEKEVEILKRAVDHPKRPLVSILGGAKVKTKIELIKKLIDTSDYCLLGGVTANTFLRARGAYIGNSKIGKGLRSKAKSLIRYGLTRGTRLYLPNDAIIGSISRGQKSSFAHKSKHIPSNMQILDIGPETEALYGSIINKASTIIWNGPMGYVELPYYRHGTAFIYYAISQNKKACSIIGGGDTISSISKEKSLENIGHLSTGGGAMLELIEKGTLPGLEALKTSPVSPLL